MQNYYKLDENEFVSSSLPKLSKAVDTAASNFSGTGFPTTDLMVGMLCYRTDEKKLYQLTNDNPASWKVIFDLNFDAGQAVKDGNGNNIAKTYLTKTEASSDYVNVNSSNRVASINFSDGIGTVKMGNGSTKTFDTGLNMLKRNTAYKVGDIAYSPHLPSGCYLECITAGTTGNTSPDFSSGGGD